MQVKYLIYTVLLRSQICCYLRIFLPNLHSPNFRVHHFFSKSETGQACFWLFFFSSFLSEQKQFLHHQRRGIDLKSNKKHLKIYRIFQIVPIYSLTCLFFLFCVQKYTFCAGSFCADMCLHKVLLVRLLVKVLLVQPLVTVLLQMRNFLHVNVVNLNYALCDRFVYQSAHGFAGSAKNNYQPKGILG